MNEENDSLEEARLPTFFLASSASLLTFALSAGPTAARQGILLTVLLWLSATLLLEGHSTTFTFYPHVVFWFALVSFVLKILRAEQPHRVVSFDKVHPLATSCLVGSWTALWLDTFFATWVYSYTINVCALLVSLSHAVYQYDRRRRRSFQRGMEGLPLVTSRNNLPTFATNASSQRSHHNEEWYRWNIHESLQWIASTTTSSLPEHGGETVMRVLGSERLTCRQLLGLSATELHQMTHLPLGVILQLLEQVQTLQEQFPCPPDLLPNYPPAQSAATRESSNPTGKEQRKDSSWLDRYDAEYSHSESQMPSDTAVPDEYNMDGAISERASSLMKERFGLELPEIRAKSNDDSAASRSAPPQQTRQAPPPFAASGAAPLPVAPPSRRNLDALLPPDFLANMPPHIAAIAHSKPDLVRKILASKRSGVPPLDNDKMPAVAEQDDEDEDYAASGDEGERTELLRQRRKKPPPQAYNSIWDG